MGSVHSERAGAADAAAAGVAFGALQFETSAWLAGTANVSLVYDQDPAV